MMRRTVGALAASALARPSLYAIPAGIPALRLGEMVFHPPAPVRSMPLLSLQLLPDSLVNMERTRAQRAEVAGTLERAAARGSRARPFALPLQAIPGYLRLALRAPGTPSLPYALGVVRPYTRTLEQQHEVAAVLTPAQGPLPGAQVLADDLITVPVHERLAPRDVARLVTWLETAA
jgi:hypothetical protein